jgi:hypothetical protein
VQPVLASALRDGKGEQEIKSIAASVKRQLQDIATDGSMTKAGRIGNGSKWLLFPKKCTYWDVIAMAHNIELLARNGNESTAASHFVEWWGTFSQSLEGRAVPGANADACARYAYITYFYRNGFPIFNVKPPETAWGYAKWHDKKESESGYAGYRSGTALRKLRTFVLPVVKLTVALAMAGAVALGALGFLATGTGKKADAGASIAEETPAESPYAAYWSALSTYIRDINFLKGYVSLGDRDRAGYDQDLNSLAAYVHGSSNELINGLHGVNKQAKLSSDGNLNSNEVLRYLSGAYKE